MIIFSSVTVPPPLFFFFAMFCIYPRIYGRHFLCLSCHRWFVVGRRDAPLKLKCCFPIESTEAQHCFSLWDVGLARRLPIVPFSWRCHLSFFVLYVFFHENEFAFLAVRVKLYFCNVSLLITNFILKCA